MLYVCATVCSRQRAGKSETFTSSTFLGVRHAPADPVVTPASLVKSGRSASRHVSLGKRWIDKSADAVTAWRWSR
jgi:hypothetical protein